MTFNLFYAILFNRGSIPGPTHNLFLPEGNTCRRFRNSSISGVANVASGEPILGGSAQLVTQEQETCLRRLFASREECWIIGRTPIIRITSTSVGVRPTIGRSHPQLRNTSWRVVPTAVRAFDKHISALTKSAAMARPLVAFSSSQPPLQP